MLKLRKVNLYYPQTNQRALEDVSLSISKGEYIGLIGPNGAGKTSLLKIILGVSSPSSGEVIRHKDLEIGYVPQSFFQKNSFQLSVQEVLELGLKRISFWRKKDEKEIFAENLNKVGLNTEMLHYSFHSLSGGQQQRVIIAKALLNHPTLLLFDEPLSGVDHKSKAQIYKLLSKINKDLGTTIILVSHEVESVVHQCKRILCLNKQLYEGCHPIDFINNGHTEQTDCPIHYKP